MQRVIEERDKFYRHVVEECKEFYRNISPQFFETYKDYAQSEMERYFGKLWWMLQKLFEGQHWDYGEFREK